MASIIVNYFRTHASTSAAAADPSRAHTDIARRLSHRLPQYLLQLLAKRGSRVYEDDSEVPTLSYGETRTLESRPEHGQIDPGVASMTDQLHLLEHLSDPTQCGPFLGSKSAHVCMLHSDPILCVPPVL